MFEDILNIVKRFYGEGKFIPLHEPRFVGKEKEYLAECIDSTFVSSVGKFVDLFEEMICDFTGAKYAVATMNGTSALHLALVVGGVNRDDEVITQALTFCATANAILYTGASPIFLDSSTKHLGMSSGDLERFLHENVELRNDGFSYNKKSGKRVKACVPVHIFGHPCNMKKIKSLCAKYNIILIEDAAESLGSFQNNIHTGLFGDLGIFSLNGNKVVTSGGGGVIVTSDKKIADLAKHLSTTGKVNHKWKYYHDQFAFNYRLPNINAALACAQLENLNTFLKAKREVASYYRGEFDRIGVPLVWEPKNSKSNFWLNAIILNDARERDKFLEFSNENGVMTRPCWELMTSLPHFCEFQRSDLKMAKSYSNAVVNIPSSVPTVP